LWIVVVVVAAVSGDIWLRSRFLNGSATFRLFFRFFFGLAAIDSSSLNLLLSRLGSSRCGFLARGWLLCRQIERVFLG